MFNEKLKKLCLLRGVKQTNVLKELNISPGNTAKRREGTLPNGTILIKLSNYFDCSIDYLLGRTETIELNEVELTDKKNDLKDIKLFLEMFPEKTKGFIYENDIVQHPSKFKGSNVYFVRAVHYNKLEEIYNKAFEFGGDNIISKEKYEGLFEFYKDKINGDFGVGFTLTKDNYKEFKKIYNLYVKSFTSRIFISYRN